MTAHPTFLVGAIATYTAAMTALGLVLLVLMLTIGASLVVSWRTSRAAASSLRLALKGDDDVALLAAIGDTPISVLAADDSLRREVYEVLDRLAPPQEPGATRVGRARASTPEMTRQRAFISVDQTFANLPPTIPEDAANPPQKACMDSLTGLRPSPPRRCR